MNKILKADRLKLLDEKVDDRYQLYLFIPRFLHLFPKSGNMHKMNLQQRIRFLSLFLHGYRVYVLANENDDVLGCALFANGGSYRYPFAGKHDLICGPYYTMPECRNQGIAGKLLAEVISKYETQYETIWAHIWHTNIASIKCMEKVGFQQVGYAKTSRMLHKMYPADEGPLVLVALRAEH